MNLTDYEHTCALTKNLDDLEKEEVKSYLAIGLAGEVGEVLNLLKKKQYYEKPSKIRREKRNLAKLRNKYSLEKDEKNY